METQPTQPLDIEVRLPSGIRVAIDGILAAATVHPAHSTAPIYPRELELIAAIVAAVGVYRSR